MSPIHIGNLNQETPTLIDGNVDFKGNINLGDNIVIYNKALTLLGKEIPISFNMEARDVGKTYKTIIDEECDSERSWYTLGNDTKVYISRFRCDAHKRKRGDNWGSQASKAVGGRIYVIKKGETEWTKLCENDNDDWEWTYQSLKFTDFHFSIYYLPLNVQPYLQIKQIKSLKELEKYDLSNAHGVLYFDEDHNLKVIE